MSNSIGTAITCITLSSLASAATAQWITFTNQTASRLPTGTGQNDSALTTNCPEEKDFAWGDVDHDGDVDLVCVRKRPLGCEGGRRNLLLMNEGGVLIDRAAALASAAIGVPANQGQSLGFLDPTNDRHAVLVDVDNDGWVDLVTATTMSDGLPRYLGHPRVYMNLGVVEGAWQGFRYEYDRFPQLLSKTGVPANPRFNTVAAGDINGDGYVDLYFADSDTPEPAYCQLVNEPAANDMDNKLLVNSGAANPGYFVDESIARMGATTPDLGGANLLSKISTRGLIADMNHDGLRDVVRTCIALPLHLAVLTNPPLSPGVWTTQSYKTIYVNTPFDGAAGFIDGDGRLDLVITDDSRDRYSINTGNAGDGSPMFVHSSLSSQISAENEFGGTAVLVDLDNDGRLDVIIADQDFETNFAVNRRTRIYRNAGSGAGPQLIEESPAVIPVTEAKAVYNTAAFDINGDGWKDIIFGRGSPAGGHFVGSTAVWMNDGNPALTFNYPQGLPTSLPPQSDVMFQVQVGGLTGGTPQPGSAVIHVSVNGGAFAPMILAPLGGDLYQAVIPAQECGTSVRYYFSAQTTIGGTFVDPVGSPANHYSAASFDSSTMVITEDFEGPVSGWTVQNDPSLISGSWELADPNGTWNEGLRASPEDDASVTGGKAFVTGEGTSGGSLSADDVDGGPTHLISPVFNAAGGNAIVTFHRWFYSNTPCDVLRVEVSNDDGINWTIVKEIAAPPVYNWNGHSSEYTQSEWIESSFTIGDHVALTNQMRVRFTANDITPVGIVEAGVDDFTVTLLVCDPMPCLADVNASGAVDIDDLVEVITTWGPCSSCDSDINQSGVVDIDDLVLVITHWGLCR